MGRPIPCAVTALHKSEGGIRQGLIDHNCVTFAREVSRYISSPSTVRVRTLEKFGRAPTLEQIVAMRSAHDRDRAAFRNNSDVLGEEESDDVNYTFKPRRPRSLRAPPPPMAGVPDWPAPTVPMIVPEIISAIAREFGLTGADMTGPCRRKHVALARRTCAYVLWRRGNGYDRVGSWLGGRDHSTVIHACRVFEQSATLPMRALAQRFIGRTA